MKFDYDLRVEWRANNKADHKDGLALGGIVGSDSTSGPATEKALAVSQLQKVFEAANQARAVTILVRLDTKPFFPVKRLFDFLSVGIHDTTSSKHGLLLTAKCHDLTVDKASQVKQSDEWFQAVTLKLAEGEDFTTALP